MKRFAILFVVCLSSSTFAQPVLQRQIQYVDLSNEAWPIFKSVFEDEFGTPNLLMMSDFEFDLGGKRCFPWTAVDGKNNPVPLVVDEKETYEGDRSCKVVLQNVETFIRPDAQPVIPGKPYTFSVYVKGRAEAVIAHIEPVLLPGTDVTIWPPSAQSEPLTREQLTGADDFTRLVCTLQVPDDVFRVQPVITAKGPGTLYIDAAQFEQDEKASEYAQGPWEEMLPDLIEDFEPQSWTPGVRAAQTNPPVLAFDGRLDTMWMAENIKVPQDLGLTLLDEPDLKGVRVIFQDQAHRPPFVNGIKVQSFDKDKWEDIPARVIDGGATLDFIFREATTVSRVRVLITAAVPDGNQPVIREILFWFDE